MSVKFTSKGLADGTDSTKELEFNVSGVTTGTTRTITVPDSDVDLGKMGKVLQVVQTVVQGVSSFSLANTWADAGLSASITPSSTTSKILVMYTLQFSGDGAAAYPAGRLKKDGSPLTGAISTYTSTKQATSSGGYSASTNQSNVTSIEYLDSPNTSSLVTYGIDVTGFASRTFYINGPGGADMNQTSGISTITLMEIGA